MIAGLRHDEARPFMVVGCESMQYLSNIIIETKIAVGFKSRTYSIKDLPLASSYKICSYIYDPGPKMAMANTAEELGVAIILPVMKQMSSVIAHISLQTAQNDGYFDEELVNVSLKMEKL